MDRDFHYYATYLAAHTAGFDNQQSRLIATSAQFIDDCTEKVTYDSGKVTWSQHEYTVKIGATRKTFYPIITSVWGMTSWAPSSSYDENREIWMPFHFLPGNYPGQKSKRVKLRTDEHEIPKNSDSSECIDLLCRPRSDSANNMVNYVGNEYHRLKDIDPTLALMLVGNCMHVFADTYAHQDFAGTCSVHLNSTKNGVRSNKGLFTIFGEWDGLDWIPDEKTMREIDWPLNVASGDPLNIYSANPTNYTALGHGQMGHIPDVSTVAFQYHPKWSAVPITRNNPKVFITAFIDMVAALKAIRENKKFDWFEDDNAEVSFANNINANLLKSVKQAICPNLKDPIDQKIYDYGLFVECKEWFLASESRWIALNDKYCSGNDYQAIPGYNEAKYDWPKQAQNLGVDIDVQDFINTDFIKWNCAAKLLFRNTYAQLRTIGNGRTRIIRDYALSKTMNPKYYLVNEVAEYWPGYGDQQDLQQNVNILGARNSDTVDNAFFPEYYEDNSPRSIQYGDWLLLKTGEIYISYSDHNKPGCSDNVAAIRPLIIEAIDNSSGEIKSGDEVYIRTVENSVGNEFYLDFPTQLTGSSVEYKEFTASPNQKWKISINFDEEAQLLSIVLESIKYPEWYLSPNNNVLSGIKNSNTEWVVKKFIINTVKETE